MSCNNRPPANPAFNVNDEGVQINTDLVRSLNFTGVAVTASETLAGEIDIAVGGGSLIASRELYVDPNRTDTYAETGSIQHPYKTLHGANNNAQTGDVIHLTPATYSELLLYPSSDVTWIGHNAVVETPIFINSSGRFEFHDISFYADNSSIIRNHSGESYIKLVNCNLTVDSISNDIAFFDSNSNTASVVDAHNSIFVISSGSGVGYSAPQGGGGPSIDSIRRFTNCSFIASGTSNRAIELIGGNFLFRDCEFYGQFYATDAIGATRENDINIFDCLFTTSGTPPININDATLLSLFNATIDSDDSLAVAGDGDLRYSLVSYKNVEGSFASTLNSVSTEKDTKVESINSGNEMKIPKMVRMTSADYALITPDPETLYIII